MQLASSPTQNLIKAIGSAFASERTVIIVVTILYLLAEITYNHALLGLFIDANTTQETVDTLSTVGKALAAFGLCWAFLRPWLSQESEPIKRFAIFAGATVITFLTISAIYSAIIRNLSDEIKADAYRINFYRSELLQGRSRDTKILPPGRIDEITMVSMLSLPLMTVDTAAMNRADDLLRRRLREQEKKFIAQVTTLADRQWPQYNQASGRLMDGHREFVFKSRQAETARCNLSCYTFWGPREKFKSHAGIYPNSKMTFAQFIHAVDTAYTGPLSKLQPALKALRTPIRLPREVSGKSSITFPPLPMSLNRSQFDAFFDSEARKAADTIIPDLDLPRSLPDRDEVAASVFVPPIAMTLSLFAIAVNAAALLGVLADALFFMVMHRRIRFIVPAAQACALVLLAAASAPSAHADDAYFRHLEYAMATRIGLPAQMWARAGSVQADLIGLYSQYGVGYAVLSLSSDNPDVSSSARLSDPASDQHAAPDANNLPVSSIRRWWSGQDLDTRLEVQRRLAAYGAYNGNIDGIFGPATARAVQFFHRRSSRSSADALDWFVDDLRREVPNGG